MKKLLFCLLLILIGHRIMMAQYTNKLLEQPHLETVATYDTSFAPNQIYLHIGLAEYDTKDKVQIEDLELRLEKVLKTLQIDITQQLKVLDISSNFKRYFLTNKKVLKTKSYQLLVYNATTAMQVIQLLEQENISNVKVHSMKHAAIEAIKRSAKSRAIQAAKLNTEAMLEPLDQKVKGVLYVTDVVNKYNNQIGLVSELHSTSITSSRARKTNSNRGGFGIKNEDIQFLELEVTMKVKVIFAIEAK